MNLLLENACIHWNDVDLEFLFTDFERFWFCFWFKSFSKWFCLRIHWFTTVETRCKPWNPYGFQRFFRVSWLLNQNSSNLLRIYIDSDSLLFSNMQEVSFLIFTWFYSEIWFWVFRMLRSWFCLLILGLKSGNKPVICLSSSSPVQNPWNSFSLLLLNLRVSVIVLNSLLLAMDSMLELQKHRLSDEDSVESLRATRKFHWFWLNLLLKRLGFVNLFFNLSEFVVIWSNWMEREICELFVTWHWFCGPPSDWYSNRPYIGCHVASGPMEMWHLDWYLLAWHLD